jgi:hypothetical protein
MQTIPRIQAKPMSDTAKPLTPFTLNNGWIIEFPTEPAGVLRLEPGAIRFDVRLSLRHHDGEGWCDVAECRLRLADVEGHLWEATTTFRSPWLLTPLLDLSRKESARWLRRAPPEWQEGLKQAPLIKLVAAYDDRIHRYPWIDNTGFYLRFKYQPASFVIAALAPDKLVVEVGDLFCSWNPLPAAGPDGAPAVLPRPFRVPTDKEREEEDERNLKEGWSGDYEHIHPLAYPIEAGRVIFRNTAVQDTEGKWRECPSAVPVIFHRVNGMAAPQSLVAFHSGTTLTPLRADNDDGGFVRVTLNNELPLELLTDASGRLVVEGESLTCNVKLDRHPNSMTQPADVLRCRMRLTDDDGDTWESVSLFTPDVFFEKVIDLVEGRALKFESMENPWRPSEGALLGVRALLDDGVWRYALQYDSDLLAFHTEHQRPLVDVNLRGSCFDIRITGLVGRRRPITVEDEYFVLDPAARAAEISGWEKDQLLPPIRFSLPVLDLALRNTTFAVDDGFSRDNAIPIPVVFTRIGKSEPCVGVRFQPDAI